MAPSLMKYNPAFLDDDTLIRSFVARHAELDRILEVLRENTGGSNQHLLIIGPRGIGKTTLVLRAAAEIRAEPALSRHWYPIVFGEETYQASTPGEFWLEALFHLGQQTGESRWQQAYDELLLEQDEGRLRQRVLAQLMDSADEQGKRLALVVENLNMLIGAQISGDDVWVLRHTLMNEPRIMLIGTATSRFREMEQYDQALYEMFRIVELEPLDQTEARALWTAATGEGVTARKIRPLQILTGGNPRLIRILSEFAASTSFQSLMDDLTRLVDEHTEYFKHHLDSLAPLERKVFVALADLWDPSTARQVAEAARLDVNMTSAVLKRLVERGAVTVPYKRGRAQYYQVAERMYNIYHLMRRRGQAASRVHAVVRFMVSLYRDEDLLWTTRSLVEEASRLKGDQQREHLLAYEAILTQVRKPKLAEQLVEATRFAFETMPDLPASLRELIGPSAPADQGQVAELNATDRERLLELGVEDVDDVETLLQMIDLFSEHPDRLTEAEAAFRKVLRQDPENAALWSRFGFFLGSLMRRHADALEAFDRALALDPEDATASLARGLLYRRLGRPHEAAGDLQRAFALGAKDSFASTVLVELLLNELERPSEALAVARNTVKRSGGVPEVLNSIAWTFFRYGRKEDLSEAEVWARRAVEQAPESGSFRHTLACILGSQGKWQDALEQAAAFLADHDMLAQDLDEVVSFLIDAVAADRGDEVLQAIQASGTEEALEPLVVAIRQMSDAQVDVAREILEVAKDVIQRIEDRRPVVQRG